jgi:hypothetical protein
MLCGRVMLTAWLERVSSWVEPIAGPGWASGRGGIELTAGRNRLDAVLCDGRVGKG